MNYMLPVFKQNKLIKKRVWITLFFLTANYYCFGQDTTVLKADTGAVHQTIPDTDTQSDTLPLQNVQLLPYTYPAQMLDGQVAGISRLRTSGEPGVAPLTLIRGVSVPIGSYKDLYANQPLLVIDGIPLIRNDHPYQMAIKEYNFIGIGSGIDISTLIDMNNIEKVKVLKGAEAIARYGVHAANGAIVFTTRQPQSGNYHISANLYGGIALSPPVNSDYGAYTINGAYERDFLSPFYQQYASLANKINYPAYLADSTGLAYFGPSDWNKLYYKQALQHGASIDITGGNDRANFRFGVGEHTENGVADQTALKRYNVFYDMYVVPFEKLHIRTYVQAATASRERNHSLRERFAEMEYFPNQDFPLPPNKAYLQQYYHYLDDGNDHNQINAIQGILKAQFSFTGSLSLNSHFSIDYNDNHRNYFVPGALNDGNSYNSYFSGVNRRIRWKNFVQYDKTFGDNHLQLQLGHALEYNRMQYGYIRGYRGPTDFIKVIQVDKNDDGVWVDITHDKKLVYAYKDYLQQNIASFFGHATYRLRNKYTATLSLRSDGSSYFGNGYHWAISPVLSLDWDMKAEPWLQPSNTFDAMNLNITGGRTARLIAEDYYGYGSYYTVDIGWTGSEKVSTYASFPTLSLPFTNGYVGNRINWPYTERWEVKLDMKFLHHLTAMFNVYSRTNRDMLISIPTGGAAYGFSGQWLNGMDVRNSGVEAVVGGDFKLSRELKWKSAIVFQYNQNKLLSLPNGLQTIHYGERRLEVGKSTDQFWLLQNEGIYETDSDIPVSNGQKLSYNGIPFEAGDPRWKDVNKDNVIDDEDRVLQGHVVAPVHGGWNNSLQFKNWTLGFSFLYSFGANILNGAMAHRFDFANREGADGLDGVKELTFWEVRGNLNKYPRYNPWSLVNPYQTDQTLFYEKANYIKLQSLLLKYDMSKLSFIQHSGIDRLQLYVTGTNLMTATPYSGNDPSLAGYFGYDYNYAQPLPMTFTVGIKVDF